MIDSSATQPLICKFFKYGEQLRSEAEVNLIRTEVLLGRLTEWPADSPKMRDIWEEYM